MKHYYDRSSVEKFHFVDEQTENGFVYEIYRR